MLVDSHCHLYLKELGEDITGALVHAAEAGVKCVICPGIDLDTSRQAQAIAGNHDSVFAAAGIHPNYTNDLPVNWLDDLRHLCREPKIIALGEIGLDYHWDYSSPPVQQATFRSQLELAQELDLPVIIHNRKSDEDLINILKESGTRRGIAHCFSGGRQLADAFLELGFYISFAGNLTYKNSDLPVIAQNVPLDRLLVETDAPFLSPVPFRGKPNEPARVRQTALKLAGIKGISLDDLATATSANADKLFNFDR